MPYQPFDFQPVIIVGAARSGTNMLRDLLTQLDDVRTWPCDEINYLWRYGNAGFPTDELLPEHARPRTVNTIRRKFARQASRENARWLIEKTCANSLRINFVNAVIPEAKYLFLVRDGIDVTASAIKRWHAPLEIGYLAKKAAFIPWGALPYYGSKFLGQRLQRFFQPEQRLPTWGPRFTGMQSLLRESSLAKVCAVQWQRSVEHSSWALKNLPSASVCFIRYEQFVNHPVTQLQRVIDFLGVTTPFHLLKQAVAHVSATSVGKGHEEIKSTTHKEIHTIVDRTLQMVDYHWQRTLVA